MGTLTPLGRPLLYAVLSRLIFLHWDMRSFPSTDVLLSALVTYEHFAIYR
jgi:hypothetical protein